MNPNDLMRKLITKIVYVSNEFSKLAVTIDDLRYLTLDESLKRNLEIQKQIERLSSMLSLMLYIEQEERQKAMKEYIKEQEANNKL